MRKYNRIEVIDPILKPLVAAWDKAIDATDKHAGFCKLCLAVNPLAGQKVNGVVVERHTPCHLSDLLHQDECKAREAYLAAGGTLPTRKEMTTR